MGNCSSNDEEAQVNKQINNDITKSERVNRNVMKLLLLGAGESGKSTIFKQMKLIHEKGFSKDDRAHHAKTIHDNCLKNMKDLICAAETLKLDLSSVAAQAEIIDEAMQSRRSGLTPDIASAIKTLWTSEPIMKAYENRSQFQIADSTEYYFENVDRLAAVDFVPTDQDILRMRVKTSGIVEMEVVLRGVTFKMFDVGGQRNERRKWIHCFDNVNAVLFVASLSEYDQKLHEDHTQNRMVEALKLFDDTCQLEVFLKTPMMLFLNKRDLFAEKIQSVDMQPYFPEYQGGASYDRGVEFLTHRFLEASGRDPESIYVHVTCATDTGQIGFVFDAIVDIILEQNLQNSGFS